MLRGPDVSGIGFSPCGAQMSQTVACPGSTEDAAPAPAATPAAKVGLAGHKIHFENADVHVQRWDTHQSIFAEGVYLAHDYDVEDYFAPGALEMWKGAPPFLDALLWTPHRFSRSLGEQAIAIKQIVSVAVVETSFDVAFVVHDPLPETRPDAPYIQYHVNFSAFADDDDDDANSTTLPAHERFYAALTSMMGNELVRKTTSACIATGMFPEKKFLRVRTATRLLKK